MIVGWNVTQRILPVRVFSIASPPPGTLFATRTAAAEATTYTIPMNASCGTRRSSRGDERVSANSRAPTAVANRAKTYAQVGHLRQREVDEDHLARDHMQPQVGQHGDEHHAGHEGWNHQLETAHLDSPLSVSWPWRCRCRRRGRAPRSTDS